jgi:CheY-like chemotaxis protein
VGILADDLNRIFLPFEQVASTRRTMSDAGLGLGLAIARAIVERHDGSIRVSSDGQGKGSSFTVELPFHGAMLSAAPVAAPQTEFVNAESARARSPHILLVEDHRDTGRLLARLLRNTGFVVDHAEDIQQALKLLEDTRFDLMVSDLGLPDGTGLDLMKKVREKWPELPGICLSGFGMESDIQSSRAAGFSEHLTKPVDLQQLRAAVARVTGAPVPAGDF